MGQFSKLSRNLGDLMALAHHLWPLYLQPLKEGKVGHGGWGGRGWGGLTAMVGCTAAGFSTGYRIWLHGLHVV